MSFVLIGSKAFQVSRKFDHPILLQDRYASSASSSFKPKSLSFYLQLILMLQGEMAQLIKVLPKLD